MPIPFSQIPLSGLLIPLLQKANNTFKHCTSNIMGKQLLTWWIFLYRLLLMISSSLTILLSWAADYKSSPLAVAESILHWNSMLIHFTLGASYVVGRYFRAQWTLCCGQMLLTLQNPTLWATIYKPGKSLVFGSSFWHTFEPVNTLLWTKFSKPGHHCCKHSLSPQIVSQVQALYLKY